MRKKKSLVILAAGIGSRFQGGIKQLQSVGPSGECIMEYSIYDAMEAGFNQIVFVIRKDIQELFDQAIGNRVRENCARRGVEVVCAFQEKENLPGGYACPEDRIKPWGTGQALLSCKGMLHDGFVVINADDYYGKEAYRLMAHFLDELPAGSRDCYALAGFHLHNNLSKHGGVTRGICRMDHWWNLTSIRETKNIMCDELGPYVETPEGRLTLSGVNPVSMNMWAFTPDVLEHFENRFVRFLEEKGRQPKSEFLIPTEIGKMLDEKVVSVRVVPTPGQWFGMTYSADTPAVCESLAAMTAEGIYPDPLF